MGRSYPDHYFLKQQRKIVLNNSICVICGGKSTEVHHKDKNILNHHEENLAPVCHKCHMSFHKGKLGRKSKLGLRELAKITGLTEPGVWYRIKNNIPLNAKKHSKTVHKISYPAMW